MNKKKEAGKQWGDLELLVKVSQAKLSNVIDTLNVHIRENMNNLCKAFKYLHIYIHATQKMECMLRIEA